MTAAAPGPPAPERFDLRGASGYDRAVGERVARWLDLAPLAGEGGLFRRTHLDTHASAIYYLLLDPDFSALHALTAAETYHWYAGAALRLLLLHPDGSASEPVLGPDLGVGQRPQHVVRAGTWQGSSTVGAWSLVGTTTAPPYDPAGFRLAEREELTRGWPGVARRIAGLTRPRPT